MLTKERCKELFLEDLNELGFNLVSFPNYQPKGKTLTHDPGEFKYTILRKASQEEVNKIMKKHGYSESELFPFRYIVQID